MEFALASPHLLQEHRDRSRLTYHAAVSQQEGTSGCALYDRWVPFYPAKTVPLVLYCPIFSRYLSSRQSQHM